MLSKSSVSLLSRPPVIRTLATKNNKTNFKSHAHITHGHGLASAKGIQANSSIICCRELALKECFALGSVVKGL